MANFLGIFSLFILAFVLAPEPSQSAKILFFFPLSTYSHRITAWPLALKLAEQGHSVTFMQAAENRNPHPSVLDVIPKHTPVDKPNMVEIRSKLGQKFIYLLTLILPKLGVSMCDDFLSHEENLKWVDENHFDLVMIDSFFNDCAYGLAYKWKAKTIIFGTTHMPDWFPDTFGVPDDSAVIPPMLFSTNMPQSFFARVQSALAYVYMYFNKEFRCLASIDPMLRERLEIPEMPHVSELQQNTSLFILNTHFSEEVPRSLPPFFVSAGGMHLTDEVKPLPKDMEQFVKESPDGFIYVSFGSEADISKSPEHVVRSFFEAFRKSQGRFLWKWNGDRPKDMPENVFTSKWMPQQDILGHEKCIGFITHGGLLSMQEAVFHGVPMIVFPVFAEQDYNAERLQRTGRGIRLELSTLTEGELGAAIRRLLTDASLKHEMSLASKRFKDRPEKPVDTALWWTEYVLRHDDVGFLRPLSMSLNWYQRRQLDVWAFVAVMSCVGLYVNLKILKFLMKRVLRRFFGKSKVTSEKKSN